MDYVSTIVVYKQGPVAVRSAIVSLMKRWKFNLSSPEFVAQVLKEPALDLLPEIDERLMVRKFLVSSNQSKWCPIYASTGWFSELQSFSTELSSILDGITLLLLQDDLSDWGYEISQQGKVADRFHTNPLSSPSLSEKSEFAPSGDWSEQAQVDQESYSGNPSLVADLFGVDRNKVEGYLIGSTSDRIPYVELDNLLSEVLEIEEWSRSYQEVVRSQKSDNNWYHLIFERQMTTIEWQWRKGWQKDYPLVAPPLWVNQRSLGEN